MLTGLSASGGETTTGAVATRGPARAAAAAYLAAHGVVVGIALAILGARGLSPAKVLDRWDGKFYEQIAAQGYVHQLSFLADGQPARMNIAFFPLYPFAMRGLNLVTRLPLEACGVLISVLAAVAAAVGLAILIAPRLGVRTALLSVVVWAVGVDSLIQSMVYVQALIAALAVWSVIALRSRRWLTAALLAGLAGLCHSTALGVILVVELAAGLAAWRALRSETVRAALRPAAAMLVAPLGLLGYLVFLAIRFDRWDAWFLAESAPGWSSKFDFGRYSAKLLLSQLDGSDFGTRNGTAHIVATCWMLPALAITVLLVRDRFRARAVPWELSATVVVTLAMILTNAGPWACKPRFLIPCVGLAVLPASALARMDRRRRWGLVVALTVVSAISSAYLVGISPTAP
jgi:hypothetical protein